LRAYALEGHPPAVVLEQLNMLAWRLDTNVMATLIYLHFDLSSGVVRLANAGHLPPLEQRANGTTEYLEGGRSLPIGVEAGTSYTEAEHRLEAGSTLLLYTDGLIERRHTSIDECLDRLADDAGLGSDDDLEELCDRLLKKAPPGGEDDVALLALQSLPLVPAHLSLTMPAEPRSLGSFRSVLRRWLRECEANEDESYEIILASNEAFANSVEHAYGPGDSSVKVDAALSDGEISITVRDFGSWRDPRGDNRGRGLTLMEAIMDSVAVTTNPDEGTEVHMTRTLGRSRDGA
jgi:anti-sigma regulatory factor (Ser/Thr protein kinase)